MPQLARLARNRWLHLGGGAAASALLVFLVARSLAWREVGGAFGEIDPLIIALSLGPIGLALALRAGRWHVAMPGAPARFHQTLLTQNTGIGLNNLLPIRMMSEPLQLALITRRYGVPFPTALAGLVAGNVLDIFASGMLMGLGVVLVPGMRETGFSVQLGGALVMLVLSVLVLITLSRGVTAVPVAGRMAFFQRLGAAMDLLRGHPRLLAASFAATFAYWLCMGVAGWLATRSLGLEVSPITLATVMAAATFFVSAVPSLPGGLGTFHFAAMSMLGALGVDQAHAFTLAVLFHLQVVLPPLVIALGVFTRLGLGPVRGLTLRTGERAEPA
jgi:uncharacterized membrane protein YbhN (UPF0104 family)